MTQEQAVSITKDTGTACRARYSRLALLVAVVVIIASEVFLWATWGGDYDPSRDLPRGAAAYIELNAPWNSSGLASALSSEACGHLASRNDGDNIYADIRSLYSEELVDHEFNSLSLRVLKAIFGFDVSTYLGGRVGIGIYDLKDDGPTFAVSFARFGPVRVAGLSKAMGLLPEGFEYKKKRMGSANAPVDVFEITGSSTKLYAAELNSRIIVCSESELMRDIASGKTEPLSQDERMAEAAGWQRDSQVRFVFFSDEFRENIVPSMGSVAGLAKGWKYFNKVFNKVAFDSFGFEWVGISLDINRASSGAKVEGRVYAPIAKARTQLDKIETPLIEKPEIARVLPHDSFFAFCWEKDMPRLWQSILAGQTAEELEAILNDPASKVFEEEFFPAMAKVHAIALCPQELPPETEADFPFPSLVLAFGLDDPQTFSDIVYDTVDDFMVDLRLKHKDSTRPIPFMDRRLNHKGVEINYFEITDNKVKGAIVPAYAFVGDYWIVATSIEAVKKCVDAAQGDGSLYTSEAFSAFDLGHLDESSGWLFMEPKQLALEFNSNATEWNENLVKIGSNDIPLPELRYRPDEQARYQNKLRQEQLERKKALDTYCSALYNFSPSFAAYRESQKALEWSFQLSSQ
ncbi:MAG: hypothetical protein U5N86_13315 [Planctomycetota bacterium]|nr:hypothetical protein [Planctomycetota bacterium]